MTDRAAQIELSQRIDMYLRTCYHWVPTAALCEIFFINERALRTIGNRPGLCSNFAISGDKGFKHVRNATADEFDTFRFRIRSHAVSELRRLKILTIARSSELTGPRSFLTEINSGQRLLL